MSQVIKIDRTYLSGFVSDQDLSKIEKECKKAFDTLISKSGEGNDYLGWLDYPKQMSDFELSRIDECAKKIRSESDLLVVIGIGGSFLGSKAVITALSPYFKKNDLETMFVGNNLSSEYLSDCIDNLKDRDFSICVISKSGTTTETSIAFRLFKNELIKKYGTDFNKRIYAVTDKARGALRTEVKEEGYTSFVLPDDIGGRFSFITAVGLLPIASSGVDIFCLFNGIKDANSDLLSSCDYTNPALLYAGIRNVLYRKGKKIEALVSYEPKLESIAEWWKQLFGESEGKDKKGIFPASLVYSRDLHSLGQFFQDGERILFETILHFTNPTKDYVVSFDEKNLDGLNYLSGKNVSYVNEQALIGTAMAHLDGGCPSIVLNVDTIDAYHIGYLLYFFMVSCGVSGYILGVNPFNQPGVEAYKKNMFKLLKKPGYEN